MKQNLRFVLILALALLAFRFGFRLLVRLVQAVYSFVPMLVRVWYISIPLAVLAYFLIRADVLRRRKHREFNGLDPENEIHADAGFDEDEKPDGKE